MVFITTLTKDIYEICGQEMIESFINTQKNQSHKLYVFFENKEDLYTEYYPDWLSKYVKNPQIVIVNLMTYEYCDIRIIPFVDSVLSGKIQFTDEYSSPRSVKWFRPVATIKYASELIDENFCSIDSDCLFTKEIDDHFFDTMLSTYNIAFLGRENFKTIRHGKNVNGQYVCTNTIAATDKDTHTETGFVAFNVKLPGTLDFIQENFQYWLNGDILKLKYKTDCHTFDAVRRGMKLSYNNLCESLGELSPIGSKVIEATIVGQFMIHNKGTIGPILYNKNSI